LKVPTWALPAFLAIALTALNAAKPVVVDDTAYLLFARQIAAHPLDPYGFELFWYREPEPANDILLPPVVPYWIAGGIAIFGENLVLLKLWLAPFAFSLTFAVQFLLNRFGRGSSNGTLIAFVLGPAVLPLFNFMLDVPALALSASAVALFVRGVDRKAWIDVLFAGVLTGLAMQTKYTAFAVPIVLLGYGMLNRNAVRAVLSVAVACALFAAWESFVAFQYGEIHFLHHVRMQSSASLSLSQKLELKGQLFGPLLNHLGLLGLAAGLAVGRAVGYPRWVVLGTAILAVVGIVAICVLPYSEAVLLRSSTTNSVRLDLPGLVFRCLGIAVGTSILYATIRPLFRLAGRYLRRSPDAWFLAGWLLLEIGTYFALTPFPAARRLVPLALPVALIAVRWISLRVDQRPSPWIVVYTVALGLGLHALDCWDARAERDLAEKATAATVDCKGTVWTQGHWGWQYYCDRAGMKLVDPGQSELKAGDCLVLPVVPDRDGFYRPFHGGADFAIDAEALLPIEAFEADDFISAQTIPNLYGGMVPVHGRDHARLRVVVYRVLKDWKPELRR